MPKEGKKEKVTRSSTYYKKTISPELIEHLNNLNALPNATGPFWSIAYENFKDFWSRIKKVFNSKQKVTPSNLSKEKYRQ